MKKTLALSALVLALYTACQNGPSHTGHTAVPSPDSLRVQGRAIAKASFEALSQKLTQAMEAGGVAEALPFCHANAYPLTDSLSARLHARIRRVAVQYRNPLNAPDAREKALFDAFAAQQATGRDLKTADTAVVLAPGKVLFAKPILLLPQCAMCHGKVGETMAEADYRTIRNLYPGDRATGFSPGDLRGMWAIYLEGK